MNWRCWERIRDKRVIAALTGVATVFLAAMVVLIYSLRQRITGAECIDLDPIWFDLSTLTLAFSPLILLVVFILFWQEIHSRQSAEEQLNQFQERLRSLTSQLSLAEERERRRIAVYLHDNIGQKLAISSIKLGQLKDVALAANSESLVAGLNDIRLLFKQIIQDTKSLTFKISSPILYELGLEAAVEWLTEELQDKHGIPTYFEDDHQPKPLDEDLRVLIFQAVSELLMNVVKHARARHVQVSLWRDEQQLYIGIYDDGVGFNVTETSSRWGRKNGGFGLFSIRERLKAYDGLLDVKSTPYGTTVTLSAPLQKMVTKEQ
jgi:signal transduction histidine kinase